MSRLESDILEVKPKKQPLAPLVERALRGCIIQSQEEIHYD